MSKSVECVNDSLSFLAYNLEKKVFHHGTITKGASVTTGQPELESFETEEEMLERFKELAGEELFNELTRKENESDGEPELPITEAYNNDDIEDAEIVGEE